MVVLLHWGIDVSAAQERVRTNSKDGQRYVWIRPGSITIGCSPGDEECGTNEKPAHPESIERGFWFGQTEVTVGAYKKFANETGVNMPPESKWLDRSLNPGWQDDKMPIVNVHWDEARNFCEWIEGRLPTEKEWEYAARAGLEGARHGELDSIAWYADNSGRDRIDGANAMKADPKKFGDYLFRNGNAPHQVGQKAANPWGLYDILGNLWEWTSDAYDSESRVLRGGAWSGVTSLVRFSARARAAESHRSNSIGLRCVWMGK